MKILYAIILPLILMSSLFSSQAQSVTSDNKETAIDKEIIEVYYFHNTRRCATCNAVESVTKSTLEESYPDQMKAGTISFQSLNIEDDANEALAKKLNVSGQTLLFVKEGKKKDLTNDAFLYARNSPEKLQAKIIKTVDSLL